MTTDTDTGDRPPGIEDDLAELEAYFKKGPSVSRAACGRMVTTYRLLDARARTVGASNGHLREQIDQLKESKIRLFREVQYLCDRILELRELDADEDHRITEAANDRLRREVNETDQLNGRLLALLNGTVVALKGPHPPNGLHDLSDVPDRARELVRRWEREKERVLELRRNVRQLGDDLRLVGIAEIAQRYGLTRPEARRWTRQDGFPAPIATLTMGQLWLGPAVETYMDEHAGLHLAPDVEEEPDDGG